VRLIVALVVTTAALRPVPAAAQSTEERFHDLFVTAGYCTAFGAALGAAFLSFEANPASKLQYVAVGASLGFIGGSILGSYIIFSPMLSGETSDGRELMAVTSRVPEHAIVVQPWIDPASGDIHQVAAGLSLARF
jgi:hypothetical protein